MQVDHLKVMDWIRKNWIKPSNCPICNMDDWGISDKIIEIRPIHEQPESFSGNIYPYFFIFCRNCGYTIFVNAIIAGLIEIKPNQQKPFNK